MGLFGEGSGRSRAEGLLVGLFGEGSGRSRAEARLGGLFGERERAFEGSVGWVGGRGTVELLVDPPVRGLGWRCVEHER